jgi:drug/metabolite transporter (DMT)-like permease
MSKQKALLPVFALLIASILWGSNSTLIKLGIATIPPTIFMSIRFLIGAMAILPFALKAWKPLNLRDTLLLCLSSIFFISLGALALNVGLTKTTAINSAVIWLLAPLLMSVLSVQFLKERLSLKTFSGIVTALAGSLIIIGKVWETGSGSEALTGNLLVVIAVFCQVISVIIAKPLMRKVSTYQATFMSLFPGTLPVAVYALSQLPKWQVGEVTASSWWALASSTLVVLVANFLFYYALRYKQAVETGIYQYVDSLATFVSAWFLLDERPTSRFIAGAVLVCIGLYVAEFSGMRKFRPRRRA